MDYVIGSKEADAKKKLKDLGFSVTVVYEEDTTKDDGVVLRQSIDAGTVSNDGTKVTITVNKIAQLKKGTINVNLKALTGGVEKDESGNEINPEIELTVTAGTDTVCNKRKYRKDVERVTFTTTGRGTIDVKVIIDGETYDTKQLDLNSSNPIVEFK